MPLKNNDQGIFSDVDRSREAFSQEDLHTAILVYSGIEGIALIDEISSIFSKDHGQFILKLGLFYFTAIGQGGDYHHGFFGPLPIPGSKDYVSFVFATTVLDKSQQDSRANGKSYILTCLACERSKLPKCLDRPSIEKALEGLFASIRDVKEVDSSFANLIKRRMINGFT
ncbi:MAG: hypothetical protein ACE5OZ_19805 [Candidatus Heimdallarchaeota archaeon]